MNNYSKANDSVIKISNPEEFITNLLNLLKDEKQDSLNIDNCSIICGNYMATFYVYGSGGML